MKLYFRLFTNDIFFYFYDTIALLSDFPTICFQLSFVNKLFKIAFRPNISRRNELLCKTIMDTDSAIATADDVDLADENEPRATWEHQELAQVPYDKY